jgi:hypothetical protein
MSCGQQMGGRPREGQRLVAKLICREQETVDLTPAWQRR